MMEIIGYILAIFVGITLGLMGSGGSILTLPIFVYIFQIDAVLAVDYSLFIIGITALIGSIQHIKNRKVDYRTALTFGLPSLLAVYISRRYLVPLIPAEIALSETVTITKNMALMLVFAFVMLLSASSMIRQKMIQKPVSSPSTGALLVFGLFIGALTGLVGAGGGFLIIPSLVLLLGMPMKRAVATSLVIIAVNSLFGFASDFKHYELLNWPLLVGFCLLTIGGFFIGNLVSTKIDSSRLKVGFGWFLLIMSIYIMLSEFFNH